jgi:hypothetical protein
LALYSGVWTLRFFVSLMILGFPGCQTILNFCLKSGVHFTEHTKQLRHFCALYDRLTRSRDNVPQ